MQSLENLLGKPLYSLMETLCVNYINTKCYSPISAIHTAVGEVEAAVNSTAAIAAMGPDDDDDYEQISGLKKHVKTALSVIEDLLLAAMEDCDVVAMRQRVLFLYQASYGPL